MPPKARKGKKKVGKRTVALAKAALCNSPGDDQDVSDFLQPHEFQAKIAEMEEEMKQKGGRTHLSFLGCIDLEIMRTQQCFQNHRSGDAHVIISFACTSCE